MTRILISRIIVCTPEFVDGICAKFFDVSEEFYYPMHRTCYRTTHRTIIVQFK